MELVPILVIAALVFGAWAVFRAMRAAEGPLPPSPAPRPDRAAPQPSSAVLAPLPPLAPDDGWRVFPISASGEGHGGRQLVLRRLKRGDALDLVRDPENPHDPAAIRIVTPNGADCGWVPAGRNGSLADQMDRGAKVLARVLEITGGGPGKPRLGLVIEVAVLNITEQRRRAKAAGQPRP